MLLLREVLEYSAAEAAEMLGTTVASVNSALQRAQKTVNERMPPANDVQRLAAQPGHDDLLQRFVSAWERRDIDAMARLLAEDARFTMPPLPAWFDGRRCALMFFAERVFQTPWRLQPLRGNGQPGFACYMQHAGDDRFWLGGVVLLRLGCRVDRIHRQLHRPGGLPALWHGRGNFLRILLPHR